MNDILNNKVPFIGPSYSMSNRFRRYIWQLVALIVFRLTPTPLHRWRLLVLRVFGAQVSMEAYVYPSTVIWAPWNLRMARHATLGPRVNCYNPAPVSLGERAVVSQGAYLCTASHDYNSPSFQLFAKPISIGSGAWVATDAFIGPGVSVGEGSVVGARAVLFRDAPPLSVWVGNPAVLKKYRPGAAPGGESGRDHVV